MATTAEYQSDCALIAILKQRPMHSGPMFTSDAQIFSFRSIQGPKGRPVEVKAKRQRQRIRKKESSPISLLVPLARSLHVMGHSCVATQ
jgi:hypothetical protein